METISTRRHLNTHIFYYSWYDNPQEGQKWEHWDHEIIPHWSEAVKTQFLHGVRYRPPNDIGSCFYPERGAYSSLDSKIIHNHMEELQDHFLIVLSYWGQDSTDSQGSNTLNTFETIFKVASKTRAQLAFHIEPYKGRTAASVTSDLDLLFRTFYSYPCLYRDPNHNNKAVAYIYDSYLISNEDWSLNFAESKAKEEYLVFGLLVNNSDLELAKSARFDGLYTYFASDGFTYGSSSANWNKIVQDCHANSLLVSLSVGPGYDDSRVRPWNKENIRDRANGDYFKSMWKSAALAKADVISVTSYNEWMESTQIEAAIPFATNDSIMGDDSNGNSYKYKDYSPNTSSFYLELARSLSENFPGA